ncbi:hypothetical protein [uncultured Rhodospira sp.]|uniref:hypothetical protein n=1 Tax=uncultured Rhodospira sp. TaxID=1936189 RepID=UPI002627B560|nr:hypothetical protein [uncultured Rhodospira sp.]
MKWIAAGLPLLAAVVVALGIAVMVVVLGTDRRPSDEALLSILAEHREALTQVAEAVLNRRDGARIDLETRAVDPNDALAATLRSTGIGLAVSDPSLGGVVFPVYAAGISISGAEKGLLYRDPNGAVTPRARWVPDLEDAFAEARRTQPQNEALKIVLLRAVDDRWALVLQTF